MPVLKMQRIPEVEYVRLKLDYDPETGILRWRHNRHSLDGKANIAGCVVTGGYRMIGFGGKRYMEHRIVWLHVYGEWPGDRDIDHINGDRCDNRIANLRLADRSHNNANRGVDVRNMIGLKGVERTNSKWRARIHKGGRRFELGVYSTPEAANAAYEEAAVRLYGAFGRAK